MKKILVCKCIFKLNIFILLFILIENNTDGILDYPYLEIKYSCLSNVIKLKIVWEVNNISLKLCELKVNIINPSNYNDYQWKINQEKIRNFRLNGTFQQIERLNEILSIIGSDALYIK